MLVKKYSKFLKFFIPLLAIVLVGQACKVPSREALEASKPMTLEYWRVFDPSDSLNDVLDDWKLIHPNIRISVRTLRFEEFEEELLNALAEDRGPDLFSIPATSIRKYQSKLLPAPASLKLAFQEVKGTVKKEVITVLKTLPGPTLKEMREKFVDQVTEDVVIKSGSGGDIKQEIYALPLAVDTLALFYNKDLFNQAKIASPPKNWTDFQEVVKKLTKVDSKGVITRSGAALGTADNIERFSDILSVIMMQNQTLMTDDAGFAIFDKVPPNLAGRPAPPGEEALAFYTDFASPAKEVYTWNNNFPNSVDAFAAGKTAMFFGYSYHLPVLNVKAPKLNWTTAKLPQIGGAEVNFANYWVEVVSKKTKHPNESWAFLQFAALNKDEAKKYLARVKKPTALRELISEQTQDLELGPFAEGLLTAKNWYKGVDSKTAEEAIRDMINQVVTGTLDPRRAIKLAAQKVNATLR